MMATIYLTSQRVLLLAKAMKMFNHFTNEINIFWKPDGIVLQSINPYETVFCEVKFNKDTFVRYECQEPISCKVSMSSLILAIGNRNSHQSVRGMNIEYRPVDNKIVFEYTLENNKWRKIKIPILADNMRSVRLSELSTTMSNPTFTCPISLLIEIWERLSRSEEITMWFNNDHVLFRNFIEKSNHKYFSSPVTEYGIPSNRFQSYHVPESFASTFCLKDCIIFRQFAAIHHNMISAYFQTNGKACELVFNNENENYSARIRFVSISVPEQDLEPPKVLVSFMNETVSSQSQSVQSQSQHNRSLQDPFTPAPANRSQNRLQNVNEDEDPDEDDFVTNDDDVQDFEEPEDERYLNSRMDSGESVEIERIQSNNRQLSNEVFERRTQTQDYDDDDDNIYDQDDDDRIMDQIDLVRNELQDSFPVDRATLKILFHRQAVLSDSSASHSSNTPLGGAQRI